MDCLLLASPLSIGKPQGTTQSALCPHLPEPAPAWVESGESCVCRPHWATVKSDKAGVGRLYPTGHIFLVYFLLLYSPRMKNGFSFLFQRLGGKDQWIVFWKIMKLHISVSINKVYWNRATVIHLLTVALRVAHWSGWDGWCGPNYLLSESSPKKKRPRMQNALSKMALTM